MSELSVDELVEQTRRQALQIAALEEQVQTLRAWIATEVTGMNSRAADLGITPQAGTTSAPPRLNLDTGSDVARLTSEPSRGDFPAPVFLGETRSERSDFPAPPAAALNLETTGPDTAPTKPRSRPGRAHGQER